MEVINLTFAQMVHVSMLELRPASPSLALGLFLRDDRLSQCLLSLLSLHPVLRLEK